MRQFSLPARPKPPRVGVLVMVLTATVVLIATAVTMLGPMLVMLSDDFHVGVGEAGQLMTASAVPWGLTALLAGPLCDRFGRRPVLLGSLCGLGLAIVISSLAPDLRTLFVMRVVTGFMGGAAPTATLATLGDQVPLSRRGAAMGWVFSGFGFAAVGGVPALGALAGELGWRFAFRCLGVALLAFAPVLWAALPRDTVRAVTRSGLGGGYAVVLRLPALVRTLLSNVSERVIYGAVGLYLPPFLMQTYSLSALRVAPYLGLAAAGTVVGTITGGRLADRLYRPRVFALAQGLAAGLVLALFALPVGLVLSAALGTGFGLANSASRPSLLTLASQLSEEHRGTAMGILSCSTQVGWATASAAGGAALTLSGYAGVGWLCALVALAGAAVMPGLIRPQPAPLVAQSTP